MSLYFFFYRIVRIVRLTLWRRSSTPNLLTFFHLGCHYTCKNIYVTKQDGYWIPYRSNPFISNPLAKMRLKTFYKSQPSISRFHQCSFCILTTAHWIVVTFCSNMTLFKAVPWSTFPLKPVNAYASSYIRNPIPFKLQWTYTPVPPITGYHVCYVIWSQRTNEEYIPHICCRFLWLSLAEQGKTSADFLGKI